MSQSHNNETIRSLDLIKQVIHDATQPHAGGSGNCGGDCSNCPFAGESPKSAKKASDQETSDACDKC